MKFAIVVRMLRRLFKQLPHPHTVGKIPNCRMQKIQIQIMLDKCIYSVCEYVYKFHMPSAKN